MPLSSTSPTQDITSMVQRIKSRCRINPGRIAFPEGSDPRILGATDLLLRENLFSSVTLFASEGPTLAHARQHGLDLSPWSPRIIWANDQTTTLGRDTEQHLLAELERKGKTSSAATVSHLAENPLYRAGQLLYDGSVDCVVGGAASTTADVIRAAISTVGLAPGCRTVSGSFVMEQRTDGRLLVFADCGVVVEPTVEQLADIAASSVATWCQVAPQSSPPIVAFLSFSTKGSAIHPAAQKMADAARLFAQRHPEIPCDGELQFDAAIDPDIALRKAKSSPAAGRANVFIFPSLDAGNLAYKITQRLAGFSAYGPILQGVGKPYSDLSRGATVNDIVTVACIARLRASTPN